MQDYLRHVEMLLSPRLFIIGGGVSKKSDRFFPLIDIRTPMVPATLLNNAGIIGAAVTAEQAQGDPGAIQVEAAEAGSLRTMARTIATNTRATREELLEFLRPRHHAILMTTRKDGRPQSSPNSCGVDTEGRIVISTYPERAKVTNIRRNPRCRSACSPTTSAGRGCRSTAPPRCSICRRRWSRWSSTSG